MIIREEMFHWEPLNLRWSKPYHVVRSQIVHSIVIFIGECLTTGSTKNHANKKDYKIKLFVNILNNIRTFT